MIYKFSIDTDEAPDTYLNDNGTFKTSIEVEMDEELFLDYYEEFQRIGYSREDAVKLAKLAGIFGQSCDVDEELLKRRNKNGQR